MVLNIDILKESFDGLCVVADIHGNSEAFHRALKHAENKNLFVIQTGDLIDYGPDSPGCMKLALNMLNKKHGIFLLGNHDYGLLRHNNFLYRNRREKSYIAKSSKPYYGKQNALGRTLQQIAQIESENDHESLMWEFDEALRKAPLWIRVGRYLFAHAAFHPDMDRIPPPTFENQLAPTRLAPTIYGNTNGQIDDAGYPIRTYEWIDYIGPETIMVVGHDIRSKEKPFSVQSVWGGNVIFLDTGCSKGGILSHLDLSWKEIGSVPFS